MTVTLPGDVPLVLVKIPAGSFLMGRYSGEQDSVSNEDPQHGCTIGYDFYMGIFEVTKLQWQTLMDTTPWAGQEQVSEDPHAPADYIYWDEAQVFMTALNNHLRNTGQDDIVVRLPSETEWEYACRAGTATRYYWGDDPLNTQFDEYAWVVENTVGAGEDYAHRVGQKRPNAWGLHDMSGNVWEWCWDIYSGYDGARVDGSAWVIPDTGYSAFPRQVIRGSDFRLGSTQCRSARRFGTRTDPDPLEGRAPLGLRVAATSRLETPEFADIVLSLPGAVPLHLKRIPPGSYLMGRTPGEQDSEPSEDPQHRVTIDHNSVYSYNRKDVYLGQKEVTKRQWEALMGTSPWEGMNHVHNDPNSPAVYISWEEAIAFSNQLDIHLIDTGRGGIDTTLPSEAVWEYACRAGTPSRFYWGEDSLYTQIAENAWYQGNAADEDEGFAHIAGLKSPNAWGFHDMSGNVWEWCHDFGHPDYVGAPNDGSAWHEGSDTFFQLRGGSWNSEPGYCRSATRVMDLPSRKESNYGFRLAAFAPITAPPIPIIEEETIRLPGNFLLKLVRIPAGSYHMGRYPDELDSKGSEDSLHEVTIDEDFYLGRYEVTQRQWEAVMGTTPWWGQPSTLNHPNCPATYVSWEDAQTFVVALNDHLQSSGQTQWTVRLPNEAEWERACRARSPTRFYWGDDLSLAGIEEFVWYWHNASFALEEFAHLTGQKLPNGWGLYDMSGNVREWCQDDWHPDYTGAPSDGAAWTDGSTSQHVCRGGGWNEGSSYCRSASRGHEEFALMSPNLGFRIAADR